MKKKALLWQFCPSIFSNKSYLVDYNESEHVDEKPIKKPSEYKILDKQSENKNNLSKNYAPLVYESLSNK